MEAESEELRRTRADLESTHGQLACRFQALQAAHAGLQKRVFDTEQAQRKASDEAATVETEHSKLRTAHATLQARVQADSAALARARKQVADLEHERTSHGGCLTELQATIAASQHQVGELERALADARAKAEGHQVAFRDVQTQSQHHQTALVALQRLQAAAAPAQAQSQAARLQLEADHQALERAHARLIGDRNALQHNVNELETARTETANQLRRQVELERRYSERILQLERVVAVGLQGQDGPTDSLEWGRTDPLWDDAKVL